MTAKLTPVPGTHCDQIAIESDGEEAITVGFTELADFVYSVLADKHSVSVEEIERRVTRPAT